jgi:molybdopterin-guanine dinucleotide biosynthesis protein
MQTLKTGDVSPSSGDLVLATVHELGKHKRLELLDGRRAWVLPGDEIIVCYGNRYAPDQFEALVPDDLGLCDLVAGGGIASHEINRHERMLPPTKIQPIGLIADTDGTPLNVFNYRIQRTEKRLPGKIILVVGTSMNSGKTHTAASLIRGLKQSGCPVAGIKATGTGSGGDLWKMKDIGADLVMDFTDAGFASTYKIPNKLLEHGLLSLLSYVKKRNCDYAVVEVADGLQHDETATLLKSESVRSIVSGVVFSAYDSLGAKAGVDWLKRLDYRVLAISGMITQSPLAMREAVICIGTPVLTPYTLQIGALIPLIKDPENVNPSLIKRLSEMQSYSTGFKFDFDSYLDGSLSSEYSSDTSLFETFESDDDLFISNHY